MDISLKMIAASEFFDADWYLRTYPDVAQSGVDPVEHFFRFGARLKRDPGPLFSTAAYCAAYRDVSKAEINPLLHYIRYGRDEGRSEGVFLAEPPTKSTSGRFKGALRRRPGQTTLLLCSHSAHHQIFGGERSFLDMLDGISALGLNVVVTVPNTENSEYMRALQQRSIAVYRVPIPWWRHDRAVDGAVIGKLAQIISAESIDIVHSNTIMLREPLLAARAMGIRGVVHARELIQHDTHLLAELQLSARTVVDWLWDNADGIIANSRATALGFSKPGKTPATVYNTVDMTGLLALAPPQEKGPLRVGLISSNLPKKGLETLVQVAATLQYSHPTIRFQIIGPETSATDDIKTRIASGKLPDTIRICGYRATPAEAIIETDVVLSISSFQESFGRTVLEGMAGGRPVIVHDHGAPPELITNDVSGFVVPYEDVAAIADRLQLLDGDRALLRQMGAAARTEAVSCFGPDVYAQQLRAAYDELLSDDASSSGRLVLPAQADLAPKPRETVRLAYFMWHFPVPSETFVLNELRILRAKGVDVRVFCRHSPHKDFAPDFDIEWEVIISPAHLAQRLHETGRTMVHAHFVFPTVTEMVWPACEEANIPFTCIAHAQDIFRYHNVLKNRIADFSRSPLCRRIFTLSRFHRQYLIDRGVPGSKVMINSNCVDPDLFVNGKIADRPARKARSICAVSRFAEKKGLEHLIQAGALLEKDGITVNIYGYGELADEYREILTKNRAGNVHLHGPVEGRDGLMKVFRQHDLFVCPSVRAHDGDMDGIPTTLMESIAAGLPVLTTQIAGIPDLVQDGLTGMVTTPDAVNIAAKVREFYALPDSAIDSLMRNAEALLRRNHHGAHLVEALLRVWANETVDLMIVSWNNLPELYEVTQRLIANTSLPYHLIICDNGSRPATLAYLVGLQSQHDNVTLIINRENAYVGPGTNICLEHGRSDYAIYVCGREGMTTGSGWDIPLVHFMDANPRVGQAGTLCYSPTYLHGRDYPKGVALFDQFRNRDFATENSDRTFCHVQGGFFILRREMTDEIGGLSQAVAHAYTDVEFSYYVESCGWELGQAPGILSLYNKTRPGLFNRLDERMTALHPPTLADLPILDQIARSKADLCTACGKPSMAFSRSGDEALCPHCGSTRRSRSIQRFLTDTVLLYRRLPALAIGAPEPLLGFWRHQFQGHALPTVAMLERLETGKQLDIEPGSLDLILLNEIWHKTLPPTAAKQLLDWAAPLLALDGILVLAGEIEPDQLDLLVEKNGLKLQDSKCFSSAISHYDRLPLQIFHNTRTK